MEEGFDSWFRDQQIDWHSPNTNLSCAQFGLGPRTTTIPTFGNMVTPPVRLEPCGWFYGLPRYRQGLIPVVNNSIAKEVKEQLPIACPDVAQEVNRVQKKFLVFDQSGDQTTFIYTSGVRAAPTRHEFPSFDNPKLPSISHPIHVDDYIIENDGDASSSEMREDTEELNALLYSDDDYDEDDDDDDENEEISTGHSPSSMTGFVEQKKEIGSGEEEEVASSGGATRRRKREDDDKIVNSLEDTASSGESGINCSGNDRNEVFEEESGNNPFGNKRLKIEKMKETINLIQNLIPGDKNGKNAMMVIDEAIHYLRSLKVKAKALGLDSL